MGESWSELDAEAVRSELELLGVPTDTASATTPPDLNGVGGILVIRNAGHLYPAVARLIDGVPKHKNAPIAVLFVDVPRPEARGQPDHSGNPFLGSHAPEPRRRGFSRHGPAEHPFDGAVIGDATFTIEADDLQGDGGPGGRGRQMPMALPIHNAVRIFADMGGRPSGNSDGAAPGGSALADVPGVVLPGLTGAELAEPGTAGESWLAVLDQTWSTWMNRANHRVLATALYEADVLLADQEAFAELHIAAGPLDPARAELIVRAAAFHARQRALPSAASADTDDGAGAAAAHLALVIGVSDLEYASELYLKPNEAPNFYRPAKPLPGSRLIGALREPIERATFDESEGDDDPGMQQRAMVIKMLRASFGGGVDGPGSSRPPSHDAYADKLGWEGVAPCPEHRWKALLADPAVQPGVDGSPARGARCPPRSSPMRRRSCCRHWSRAARQRRALLTSRRSTPLGTSCMN